MKGSWSTVWAHNKTLSGHSAAKMGFPVAAETSPRKDRHDPQPSHTGDYAVLVPSKIGGVRDQMYTIQGLKVDCVVQVDF